MGVTKVPLMDNGEKCLGLKAIFIVLYINMIQNKTLNIINIGVRYF